MATQETSSTTTKARLTPIQNAFMGVDTELQNTAEVPSLAADDPGTKERFASLTLEVSYELDALSTLMHNLIADQVPAPSAAVYAFLMQQRAIASRVGQLASVLMSVHAEEDAGRMEVIVHGRRLVEDAEVSYG